MILIIISRSLICLFTAKDFKTPQNSPNIFIYAIQSQFQEFINIQPDTDQVKDDVEDALSKMFRIMAL